MKTVYKVLDWGFDREKDLGDYEAESREEAKNMAASRHFADYLEKNPGHEDDCTFGMRTIYVNGYKDETKTTRCTQCATEFSEIEMEGIKGCCPACGDKGLPMAISDDVIIKINWHELHILMVWAENWARQIKDESPGAPLTIMCIAERLQRQFPGKTPLTLFSEIRDLRKTYEVESNIDDDAILGLS